MSTRIDFTHLTPPERLALIEDLWASLSDEDALPLSPALASELERRVQAAQRDPDGGRGWEEVRGALERR
ncbi:MAG: addiction module protein [Gemmatimonadota bacterium]|nr:addiction module protein [Gemmatimonadota bacterium]